MFYENMPSRGAAETMLEYRLFKKPRKRWGVSFKLPLKLVVVSILTFKDNIGYGVFLFIAKGYKVFFNA